MEDSQDDITTQIAYSSAGKILSSTDANGNLTSFEYDGLGRLLKMSKYEGSDTSENGTSYVTTYTYTGNCGSGAFSSEDFKPSKVTDPMGNVSRNEYDALYRKIKTILENGDTPSITEFVYDAVGNKIKDIDAVGNVTLLEYDALNNVIKTTFADNSTTQVTYASSGLVLSETNELGKITQHEYDAAGRRVKTIFPAVKNPNEDGLINPVEEFSYDKNGNQIAKRDANGFLWNTVYDCRNRVMAEVSPAIKLGNTYARPQRIKIYDYVGNVISETDPNGNITTFEYDNADRIVKTIFPSVSTVNGSVNPVELKEYDKNGNVTAVVNPNNIRLETQYNYQNKAVKLIKNASAPASEQIVELMSYDANGNLVEITDGNGNKTRYIYDALNRKVAAKYAYESDSVFGRADYFVYDEQNLINRKGVAITYDCRNRISTEGDRTYAYDLCGRPISVRFANKPLADTYFTYDDLGRLISETSAGKVHLYEYDLASNRISAKYSHLSGQDGSMLTNSAPSHMQILKYDTNNQVSEIIDQSSRKTFYEYDLSGNVTKKINPNGSYIVNTYDSQNRLLTRQGQGLSLAYTYDLNGNVKSFTESYASFEWNLSANYDAFDRLQSETLTDQDNKTHTRSFSYDKNNNRTALVYQYSDSADSFTEVTAYTVNSMNQLISAVKNRQVINSQAPPVVSEATFTYNARGNMVKIEEGAKVSEFTFDEFDMLETTSISENDALIRSTSNSYDYKYRRVSHTNNSITTQYSYSEGVNVWESDGIKTTLFYRGSDLGGGVGGINYAEYADGSEFNYKYYNLRGDVIMTHDASSLVKYVGQYHSFGRHDDVQGAILTDKHRANTKVEDDDNLLNEGKRFRHLEYGVFLTPDPLEYVDGPNPYIYCVQNPWGRFDNNGEFWSAVLTVGCAIFDTYQYATGKISGAEYAAAMTVNGAALIADAATGGMGGGAAVRAAAVAAKVSKSASTVAKAAETATKVEKSIVSVAKAIDKTDSAMSTAESVGNAVEAIQNEDYRGAVLAGTAAAAGGSGIKSQAVKKGAKKKLPLQIMGNQSHMEIRIMTKQ